MGALVTLASKALEVVPGSVVSCTVTVKNAGTVVDQFTIDVLGDPGAFATADPPALSLFPGAEGSAVVSFAPPRASTTPSGDLPFGIRARSQEDPAGSAVEEGVLSVAAFSDTFAELVPRSSRGSRGATHELAVDNRGNARLNASITAADPDQLLGFDVQPPGLVVEPGTAGFAKVRVRPVTRFWRGQPKTRPFKVAVAGDDARPIVLDGTMVQEAMLPRWLVPALLALLGLLILAALIWALFLQPAIQSAATQALSDAGFTPRPSVAAGTGGASPAPGGASPSPAASAGTGASPSPAASAGPPTPTPAPVGNGVPQDGRLAADGSNPSTATFSSTFYMTDLVFANPNGRAGTLQLLRDGFVLITLRLENFRDLDFHYVTPIVIQKGQKLVFTATCTSSGACDPSVYFDGFVRP
ncbi:MAG: hypothetical protein P4L30_11625 [Candidatus Limnocylindrales bacterium]|jgi:hypothetical protein|nr:hypothetical protein [Candidatus Limnocylindrales bacterium]